MNVCVEAQKAVDSTVSGNDCVWRVVEAARLCLMETGVMAKLRLYRMPVR